MKYVLIVAFALLASGCYSNQYRWQSFSDAHACVATGNKKTLKAGSIYKVPQVRKVYEFQCGNDKVWSDLGNYGRYNEWLEI